LFYSNLCCIFVRNYRYMNKGLGIKIKKARSRGLSYNEIVQELGCAKSTVSYYLGYKQKRKRKIRALKNADKHKLQKKATRVYMKEFLWRHRKLCGCKSCGVKNPRVLQYDHLEPENKILEVSAMAHNGFGLKTIKEEIKKCQILCANCHLIKSSKEFNYYNGERLYINATVYKPRK
jgi:hypothetical protein